MSHFSPQQVRTAATFIIRGPRQLAPASWFLLHPRDAIRDAAPSTSRRALSTQLLLARSPPQRKKKSSASRSISSSSFNHNSIGNETVLVSMTPGRIRRMRKAQLQETVRSLHLNASGTRKELIPRLLSQLLSTQTKAAEATPLHSHNTTNINGDHWAFKSTDDPLSTASDDDNDDDSDHDDDDDDHDWEDHVYLPGAALMEPIQEEETTLLDANCTYVLRVKGHSKMNASGTGVGILLYEEPLSASTQLPPQPPNVAHDKDDDDDASSRVVLTARKYLAGDRNLSLAEYTALVLGLKHAIRLGAKRIIFETDHDVLEKQLRGVYPVRKRSVQPLYWQVMSLRESELDSFKVRVVESTDDVLELATKALATGRSLNMNQAVDPMGKDFRGLGKQRTDLTAPIQDSESSDIDPAHIYKLQFDGGVRGSGKAGCGMVIVDEKNKEVWCGWKFMPPPVTNNMAEYTGILLGLLCARSLGIAKIEVEGDSELIVKQLNGDYKVRDSKLQPLWHATKRSVEEFEYFQIRHIPRKLNKRADWLANHAMDQENSHGFEEQEQVR